MDQIPHDDLSTPLKASQIPHDDLGMSAIPHDDLETPQGREQAATGGNGWGNALGAGISTLAHGGVDLLSGVSYGLGKAQQALSGGGTNDFLEAAKIEHERQSPLSYHKQIDDFLKQQNIAPTGLAKDASDIGSSVIPFVNPVTGAASLANQLSGGAWNRQNNANVPEDIANTSMGVEGGGMVAGAVAGAKLTPGPALMKALGAMVGAGMASRGMVREYLKSKGYDDAAALTPEWNDAKAVVTDAVSGLVFHTTLNHGKAADKPDLNAGAEDPNKLLAENPGDQSHITPDVQESDLFGRVARNPYDVGGHVSALEQGREHILGAQGDLFGTHEGVDTRKPSYEGGIDYEKADRTPNLTTEDKNNPYQNAIPYEHTGLEGKGTYPFNEGLQPENRPTVGTHPGTDLPNTAESGARGGIPFENTKPGQHELPLDNPIEDRPGGKQGELFAPRDLADLPGGRPRAGNGLDGVDTHESLARIRDGAMELTEKDHVEPDGSMSIGKILKSIQDNATRKVERLLPNTFKRFPQIMKGMTAKYVGDRFGGYSQDPDVVGAKGSAHYASRDNAVIFGSKGLDSATFMHELFHGLTARPLRLVEMWRNQGIDTPTARQFAPYYDRLQGILNKVAEGLGYDADPKVRAQDPEFQRFLDGAGYGLANVHEFLSETHTNPAFRGVLKDAEQYKPLQDLLTKTFKTEGGLITQIMGETGALAHEHESVYQQVGKDWVKAVKEFDARKVKEDLNPQQKAAYEAADRDLGRDRTVDRITRGLPGGSEIKAEYVPAAVDPAKIKAQIQEHPDIKDGILQKVEANATVSAEGLGTLWNSDGLVSFARAFQRAHTLKDQVDKQVMEPLKRELQKLIPQSDIKSWGRVMDVMHAEDFYKDEANPHGKRLTDEQIKRALPDPKQQQLYTRLRQEFDKSLARTNAKLKEMGQEPMTAREAYTNSARHGPWSSAVYGPDGQMVGFIRGRTPQEINAGIKYIQKNMPDWKAEKASFKKQVSIGGDDNLFQTYGNVTRALGKADPLTLKLQHLLEERAQEMGMNFADYKKHMMDKTGMRFAEGDRPWLGQKRNVQEWYKNQLDVIQKSHEWAHMQDAVDHANKTLNDPELAKSHPNLMEHLREYTRRQLGFGKHDVASWVENSMAHAMGRLMDSIPGLRNIPFDMKQQMNVIREAKGVMYMMTMGFWKPGHFIINGMLQPLFTAPRHIKLTQQGFEHNPLNTFLQGAHDSATILLNHYLSPTGREVPMTERQSRMAQFIKQNGIAANNPLHDTGDIAESRSSTVIHKAKSLAGLMMTEGERLCRVQAFSSFFNHLEQSGKFGDLTKQENFNELGARAMRETTETMGSFRHDDRPAIFAKMGSTGTALATLKQFDINFFNQLQGYTKYAMQTKNYAPLLTFTAMQLMMAGTMGFIGMENVDQLWKFIRDMIPSRFVDKEFATFSPKKWMLENLNPMLSRGPVSMVTGINFASSLDAGSVVDPSLNGLFPFYSVVKDMTVPPFEYFSNPSADNLHKWVYNWTPYGSRGMIETGQVFGHDLPNAINTKDWFTSPAGQIMSPQNPGEGKYTRTPNDTMLRSSGFTSTREAMIKEADFTATENEKTLDARKQGLVKNLDSGVRNNDLDGAANTILKYIDLEGDPRDILSDAHFAELAMKWNTDYKERAEFALKTGGNLKPVYKYMNLSKTLDKIEEFYGPANAANRSQR